MAADLIDRIEWFRAPILLGNDARPGIGPLALRSLADAPAFNRVAVREAGPDLWESYERKS
jgi:diaminohydroxyphosphoribosylaminopyrimidine deaminase/5-amino-6-(5-phosphoribosylamino)uracil reductase